MKYFKKAFTLVELIIVLVILAILASIAFISLKDYPQQARDSVRKADMQTLEKALDLYKIQKGEYPTPDPSAEGTPVVADGAGWIKGKLGTGVYNTLHRVHPLPVDPSTGAYYEYQVNQNQGKFKVIAELENGKTLTVGKHDEERLSSSSTNTSSGSNGSFIIKIDTTKTTFWNSEHASSYKTSANNQYELPLVSTGSYNFTIDWGDGSSSEITSHDDTDKLHTYTNPGEYILRMDGQVKGFGLSNSEISTGTKPKDTMKLQEIQTWGNVDLLHTTPFAYTSNLHVSATDKPNFSVGVFQYMFFHAQNFTGDLSNWGTITDSVNGSFFTFGGSRNFRGNLSNWTFPNAQSIYIPYLFSESSDFQGNLSGWSFPNYDSQLRLDFCGLSSNLQGDFSDWSFIKVKDIGIRLNGRSWQGRCNIDISNLNAPSVEELSLRFDDLRDFTGDLTNLPIPSGTRFSGLFSTTRNFQGNLSGWDTSKITNMDNLAKGATGFNLDLSGWNTSSVTSYTDFDTGATDWEQSHKPVFSN